MSQPQLNHFSTVDATKPDHQAITSTNSPVSNTGLYSPVPANDAQFTTTIAEQNLFSQITDFTHWYKTNMLSIKTNFYSTC